MDNVRKSSRLQQHAKFEKQMSMFLSKSKKLQKRKHSSDSSDEAESPEKIVKKEVKPGRGPRLSVKGERTPKKKVKEEVSSDEENDDIDPEEEEEEEEEESKEDESFNLLMLNLRRVGDEPPSKEKEPILLNRRGMPQRIRKRNRLFYDDNVVNIPMMKQRVKKETPSKIKDEKRPANRFRGRGERRDDTEVKAVGTVDDARETNSVRQKIGMTLRNLLKLPKAQRWVFNEWFYSNIDAALFLGSNDFLLCLRETFANLKTTMLRRPEWCVIRRLMGKPRRCSQAFFKEERVTLEKRRNAIRMIQQRKVRDWAISKDLPERIPLQLSVNSRVTARLRKPQTGLFTGKVDAVDPSNNTYRITFDRPGLGTHSVPDFEVLLDGDVDMVSMSTMQKRYMNSKNTPKSSPKIEFKADIRGAWADNTTAKFPKNFYETIVRICKIIKDKQNKVQALKDLNEQAERMSSLGSDYPPKYQKQYASVVIDLESLNISLERHLTSVQKYCHDLAPEACKIHMLAPSFLREKSLEEARELVNNYIKDKPSLKNHKLIDFVTELVALMIQVQTLSKSKHNLHEIEILKQSVSKIKSMISPKNLPVFQNKVEVHLQYIERSLGHGDSLSQFLGTNAACK